MQTVSSSDRLVTDHLAYTAAVTIDLLNRSNLLTVIRPDEAVAYGQVGLVEAASRFRPQSGASFATFSYARIRGAVMDGIRRSCPSIYRDELKAADSSAQEISIARCRPLGPACFDPTDELDAFSLRAALMPAINALTEVERQVILLYYFEDLTLERIAERLGFTKSYVARVHHRALPQLASRLQKVGAEYGMVESEEAQ